MNRTANNNLFRKTSLGKHPLVRQRYQGKEEKLEHVLPTEATDDVLSSLSIKGTNVLNEEKRALLMSAQKRSSQEPGLTGKGK